MPEVRLLPRTTVSATTTTTTCSRWRSASPTICRAASAEARASACGRSAPSRSCWRPAPSSGRWCSPTTTVRASCWPRPARLSSTASAVPPGKRAVVFTNNDSAYRAALDLAGAGAGRGHGRSARRSMARLSRRRPPASAVLTGSAVTAVEGHAVSGVQVMRAGETARASACPEQDRLRPCPGDVRRLEPGRPPVRPVRRQAALLGRSGLLRAQPLDPGRRSAGACAGPSTWPAAWPSSLAGEAAQAAGARRGGPASRRAGREARRRRSGRSGLVPAQVGHGQGQAFRRLPERRHRRRRARARARATARSSTSSATPRPGHGHRPGQDLSNVNALAILADAARPLRSPRSAPPPSARPIRR